MCVIYICKSTTPPAQEACAPYEVTDKLPPEFPLDFFSGIRHSVRAPPTKVDYLWVITPSVSDARTKKCIAISHIYNICSISGALQLSTWSTSLQQP